MQAGRAGRGAPPSRASSLGGWPVPLAQRLSEGAAEDDDGDGAEERTHVDDSGEAGLYDDLAHDHQDPVLSMHDTEEEAGDEAGLADLYRMDTLEAEQRGVALDATGVVDDRLG